MLNIFITGGSGFVGMEVLRKLPAHKYRPIVVSRGNHKFKGRFEEILVDGINADTDWSDSLRGCDVVIHLAARVHIMNDASSDPLAEFRKVNTYGTLHLARIAAECGVKRFLYLSSIKVNGENTEPGKSFSPSDSFIPDDPYGLSKYEAEQGLLNLSKVTGMEVVIIRPSLVYGPGVKANFLSMMQWIQTGIPLPLGAIQNQRSLVALDTLVDLITICLEHPAAANQIFMVSDGEDLSTTELLQRMGKALDKPTRLLPVPQNMLIAILKLLGKEAIARRLCNSLQVDITKTRELLGWEPIINVDDELSKTAQFFLINGDKPHGDG